MFESFSQKAGSFVRGLVPLETALAFLLFSVVLWPIPHVGAVSPLLVLSAVYYWAIYRPDLFRPSIVFVLGLLYDVIHYLPIGLSAFLFLGVFQLSFANRRYFNGQAFPMLWAGFVVVCFITGFATWAFQSFKHGEMAALLPVFVQFALTVLLFPFAAWVMIKLQRAFLSQRI